MIPTLVDEIEEFLTARGRSATRPYPGLALGDGRLDRGGVDRPPHRARSPLARAARSTSRDRPSRIGAVARSRDKHDWRWLPRNVRRSDARDPLRVCHKGGRSPSRNRNPSRPAYRRDRTRRNERQWYRRAHRRARDGRIGTGRGFGLEHRERPRGRIGILFTDRGLQVRGNPGDGGLFAADNSRLAQ